MTPASSPVAPAIRPLGGDSGRIPATSTGDWQAGARCGVWRRGVALILGVLLAAMGTLIGTALGG
ncbi:MAG TPA: hypothetical protein VFV49_00485, partial [Thermoanaerobaculia bacterium]|nr:hypothetical protein [Thermoanaerobaculia bacterium]